MKLVSDSKVKKVINKIPKEIRQRLLDVRELIIKTAEETEGLNKLEETLKWGEPSYVSNIGSTIRMNKRKEPDEYALYFICSTTLVETFRHIYGDQLRFEDNRAILFNINDQFPTNEIRECIKLALTYKKIKHLPMLGM